MPPEYPEKKTQTTSTSKESMFSPNIPVVHSINGFELQQRGWVNIGQNAYAKDGETIQYDGVYFNYNGRRVVFFEDLENNKTPGE